MQMYTRIAATIHFAFFMLDLCIKYKIHYEYYGQQTFLALRPALSPHCLRKKVAKERIPTAQEGEATLR